MQQVENGGAGKVHSEWPADNRGNVSGSPEARSVILIIEDDRATRATFEAMLASGGYEVVFAGDGNEGLRLARERMPDVVLLDVLIPGMHGFEVCRQLRADPDLAEVPILMVTVLDDRESRLGGLRAGADDFLSKPVDILELRARVQTLTRLNRFRRLVVERSRFKHVLERSREGYVLLDEANRVVYANPRARTYLEIPPGDPAEHETFLDLGRRHYELQPSEAWADWPAPTAADRYLVRPESETAPAFWLRVEDLPRRDPRYGRVLVLCDVTSEVVARRDVLRFQAAISHKLRTPLTIMFGSLELIAGSVGRLPEDEVADMARTALRGGRRLLEEVEDVLRYVQAPAIAWTERGCPVERLGACALATARDLEVSLEVRHGTGTEGRVLALSEEAVELLFSELLGNAKKFHPRKAPTVELVTTLDSPHALRLCLHDDGVHLTPAQLERVTVPYHQSHKHAWTGEVPGLGLGLSLVAILVWSAGGRTAVYNRPDRPGIVVDLTVPFAPEQTEHRTAG